MVIILIVNVPNLPKSRVKCVIADCNAPKSLFDFLNNNKIKYIKSIYIKNTIDAVSTHPDMQICHIGGNRYICEPSVYDYYAEKLNGFGLDIIKGNKHIFSTYPDDISYNVVITDKFFMHCLKYTDDIVKQLVGSTDISIYNVKQGYTKCATCIIDNNAVITSDKGIYKVCIENSVDSVLIENDKIKLGDRSDGFIGGCCGMIDCKTLLFCGDISSHKSYNKIVKFASKYGVKIICSSKDVLTDVGSIIPVIQE